MIKKLIFIFCLLMPTISFANDAEGKRQLELGKIEANKGNHDVAIEHFKQCVYLYTGCAYNIGVSYEKTNRQAEAIPYYDISARLGLPQAKTRLAQLNQPIPDNDLEREYKAKQKAAADNGQSFVGLTVDVLNALVGGYNRGADAALRNRPRSAMCTTTGNVVNCTEY